MSALNHEVGHVIERDLDSVTMYPTIGPGETHKRSLHNDDRAGASALYDLDFVPVPDGTQLLAGCRHEGTSGLLFRGLFVFPRQTT